MYHSSLSTDFINRVFSIAIGLYVLNIYIEPSSVLEISVSIRKWKVLFRNDFTNALRHIPYF